MDNFLCERVRQGKVTLFLGAGASIGSRNQAGGDPPLGDALAKLFAVSAGVNFKEGEDTLRGAYSAAIRQIGDAGVSSLLRKHYQHCEPSHEYTKLANYAWRRIYTTNIDDALDKAFARSVQHCHVINGFSRITDKSSGVGEIQIIKLNGNVGEHDRGFIFAADEYARGANAPKSWYEELASDYFSDTTLVFIGSRLDEPIFEHHISRFQQDLGGQPGKAYIICRTFTDIQRLGFEGRNIAPIAGTLNDFVEFLDACLGKNNPPSRALAAQEPGFSALISNVDEVSQREILSEAQSITVVTRALLEKTTRYDSGVRDFYRGTRPSWRDILDGVPAQLSFYIKLNEAIDEQQQLIVVHGSAGCGKSTAIMAAALKVSDDRGDTSVFFVKPSKEFPASALRFICKHIERPLIVLDSLEFWHGAIRDFVDSGALGHGQIIVADRTRVLSRVSDELQHLKPAILRMTKISSNDVDQILAKLENYGPWSRLGKMTLNGRRDELIKYADRQLLIALRAVTLGPGYDAILKNEYESIVDSREKLAFHITALASMHRLLLTSATFDRAIRSFVFPRNRGLEGILFESGSGLELRHPIIADYIVRKLAPRGDILEAIRALFSALGRFQAPLRFHAKYADFQLLSYLSNSEFLWSIFKKNPEDGLSIYKDYEQKFQADGLFLLHFALFERKLGAAYRERALSHIRLALEVFPTSFHIVHAYSDIHFDMAVDAKDELEALSLMETASLLLEEQIASRTNVPYALVTLSWGKLKVYKKWFPEQIRAHGKEILDRLQKAQKNYPGNTEIKRALYEMGLHISAFRVAN